MKRLFIPLVLSVICPTFIWADLPALNQNPDVSISLGVLKIPGSQIIQNKALDNTTEAAVMPPKVKSIKFQMLLKEIEKENGKNDPIAATLFVENTYAYERSASVLSEISPDYRINKNFLSLTKVATNRRKESIMFTFLMNKDKVNPNLNDHPRHRMHVLWPSKRMMLEQMVIDDQYPVDLSVAKYQDGYAPREWNLVLPNKKPREVGVSLLWSF
jgi:hypothetical protein